jgi:ribonuclease BN (tRNA processing enzyme)
LLGCGTPGAARLPGADGAIVTVGSVQIAGSGTAFHQDGRGSQCLLVQPTSSAPFLVDLGPTAICGMERYGFDYARVARVFVTHLHGDHTAGWPFLLLNLRFVHGRVEPLDLVGPLGARRHLQRLSATCYGDLLEPKRLGFEIRYHELQVGAVDGLEVAGGRFDLVPVEHDPSSIGYRFHLEEGSLAVTGDTRWCSGLERLASGTDLLIMECTTVRRTELSHVSLEELREKANRLGTRRVVLVHLGDEVAAALAADPIAGIVAGYDGMVVPLAEGGPVSQTEA